MIQWHGTEHILRRSSLSSSNGKLELMTGEYTRILSGSFTNERQSSAGHSRQYRGIISRLCQKGFGGFGVNTVIRDCSHEEPFINLVAAITYSVGPVNSTIQQLLISTYIYWLEISTYTHGKRNNK